MNTTNGVGFLVKQGLHKRLAVKNLQIVYLLADTDIFYGYLELI